MESKNLIDGDVTISSGRYIIDAKHLLTIGIISDIIQYFVVTLFLSYLKADRERCHAEENSCRKRVLIFEVSFNLFFAIFFGQDFKIGFKCHSKFALAVIADSPCNLRNVFIGFF